MTILTQTFIPVNTGTSANDGSGDSLRTAFIRVNQNFSNITSTGFNAGNIIAAGTVQAAYIKGDGSQLTNVPSAYGNANVAVYLPTYSGNIGNLNVTGTLTYVGQVVTGDVEVTGNLKVGGGRIDAGYQYSAAVTGFAITTNANVSRVIFDPAGTLANGTLTLPSGNVDAKVITVSSTQTITAFQVLPNTGTTLVPSANVTLTAGTSVTYFYHASESKWYKIG